MAQPEDPLPVKYFIAVLFHDVKTLQQAKEELVAGWSAVDFEGRDHLFDATNYYQPEMGAPLYRRLLAFERLYTPAQLVSMKLECNEIEALLSHEGKRTVNLDAGYLDHNKCILASAKAAGQKVYLDKGIYADLCGRYKAGIYRPFEWSFPDFRDGRYDEELLAIRKTYLRQLKKFKSETPI
jgi:Zn-finger nucleic acid-binding protein